MPGFMPGTPVLTAVPQERRGGPGHKGVHARLRGLSPAMTVGPGCDPHAALRFSPLTKQTMATVRRLRRRGGESILCWGGSRTTANDKREIKMIRSWYAIGIGTGLGLALAHASAATAQPESRHHHGRAAFHRHAADHHKAEARKEAARREKDAKTLSSLKTELRDLRRQVVAV